MRTPSRNTLVIIGIAILFVSAGIYVALRPNDNSRATKYTPNPAPTTQSVQPTPTAEPEPTSKPQPGRYVDYSEDAFNSTDNRRVLFFHAAWCPQCRNIEKTITQDGIPNGMTIFKVDYDTAQTLRKKYGVTLQTTFVEVNMDGSTKIKHVAYNEPTIAAVLKAIGQ